MKKLFALAMMAAMVLFSLAAIAQVITSVSLDSLHLGEAGYKYSMWLIVGLGLLCLIELRGME